MRLMTIATEGSAATVTTTTAPAFSPGIVSSIRAPDMNAFCERFVRTISDECLDHVVFLSEEHRREYVAGYIAHYNEQRPHQGLGNVPIGPWKVGTGDIVCDESLHGLLKSFRRAA